MDITAVLTCHHEGLLLGPSLASFAEAIHYARAAGNSVEALLVIDRGDRLTKSLAYGQAGAFEIIETDCGDPGQTRNAAVAAASGTYVSFLDGDDLWSYNWLHQAAAFARAATAPVICHSQANVVFGAAQQMWWHADSMAPGFDHGYMLVGNYWDAMCLAPRDTLARFPFRRNNLAAGYGHEDWHWNCTTLSHGIHHRPVADTIHFKRRRKGSQMAKCEEQDVVTYPTEILALDWQLPPHPHSETMMKADIDV